MSEQSAFPLFNRAGIAIHADRNRFVSSFVIGVSSARLNHIYMEPLSLQPGGRLRHGSGIRYTHHNEAHHNPV